MTASERIIVGISGGVDSAVAALILQRQGHEVEGLFMKNWDDPDDAGHCPMQPDLEAARTVCDHLGIRLHQADFTVEYWNRVFEAFLAESRAGRTPNPDVLCNRTIKFEAFLDHALELGATAIATGHYARIADDGHGGRALLRGRDPDKDQSYFLHAVRPRALARSRFPLGEIHKPQVRAMARAAGLPNHDRADSTGICFIGERRFRDFLGQYLPPRPGPMVTPEGDTVGEHAGLMFYTLGQRQGLGIGGGHGRSGEPWYVLAKSVEDNTLVVGQGHDHPMLFSGGLVSEPVNWVAGRAPELPLECEAQVRYRQRPFECRVDAAGDGLRVTFARPQRAVTPGQSLVLYRGARCLGGAVIAATTGVHRPATAPDAG